MKKIYLLIFAAMTFSPAANAWNSAIHTGIAAIADANLTPATKKAVAEALDGHTIANYAYWMDDVAGIDKYAASRQWHNVALTPKGKIIVAKKAAKSQSEDIRSAQAFDGLVKAIEALKKRDTLSKEEIADNIRFIVYILADLHCPSHYVYSDLLAERSWKYFRDKAKKGDSYMTFWDGISITGTFNWRANEFAHQLNRKSAGEIEALTDGSITKWIESNAAEYRKIYSMITPDKRFDGKEFRLWLNGIYPFSTEQVAVAGYRIAKVLNGLFDDGEPAAAIK